MHTAITVKRGSSVGRNNFSEHFYDTGLNEVSLAIFGNQKRFWMFQLIYRLIARVLGGKRFGIAWVQIVSEEHIGNLRI